jgi:calcium-translocating P-type ATPase
VLRDEVPARVPTSELVHGDVLLLGAGDRVPADARVLTAEGLEVDEAALTGESLPVAKSADNGTDASRILLEGSDVTSGRGNAVIVAVGAETRLGATAAALAGDERPPSALEERLRVIVARGLPLMVLSGAALTALGVLRGRPLVPQLALGASLTIAAVPEGLPLLAGIAEAGVARRLAPRRALVSRLSAVEALGRVDVACADKTGTLTEGRLAVTRVVDTRGRSAEPEQLDPALSDVLVGAALASPHPDAPDAAAHPTDVAVLDAAARAGLGARVRIPRDARAAFDPTRAFHAEVAGSRLHVKGAAEVLVDRCAAERVDGRDLPLDDDGRHALLEGAHALAREGLRVLMVAEGEPQAPDSPHDLTAVGFVAISDPLRETVPAAIERCHAAGVHVLMITGDHPETARAVAAQAGLSLADDGVLVGSDITALTDDELRARLEHATVVARTTPLDKVRIIEALQQGGHVVAMTGDGVNDAPALRLADVGVAIGERSTEVARQTADLIVTDGDFSTLVEALVEGRSFWHNMRRSLGLLLGGNAGEVGLVLLAAAVGLPVPLTTRQILTVNVATDVLPAVAIALQHPEHRNLAELAREGGTALDKPLRNEIVRRAVATGLPSFGAYVLASRRGGRDASSVAFASIVTTQLAQTLDMGRADGRLPPMVLAAVAASLGLTAAALTVPGLRGVLGLALPGPDGLLIIGGATATAVAIARVVGGRPAA